jgi:hypothetical protein
MLSQAIDRMGAHIVLSNTIAGPVIPILRAMLTRITWVDSSGKEFDSGITSYLIHEAPPSLKLNLRMLLDDRSGENANPSGEQQRGPTFTAIDTTNGILTIFIRYVKDVNGLSNTLYHESLLMMYWLINPPGPRLIPSDGRRSAEFALYRSHYIVPVAALRRHLEQLAQNIIRTKSQGTQVLSLSLTEWRLVIRSSTGKG